MALTAKEIEGIWIAGAAFGMTPEAIEREIAAQTPNEGRKFMVLRWALCMLLCFALLHCYVAPKVPNPWNRVTDALERFSDR